MQATLDYGQLKALVDVQVVDGRVVFEIEGYEGQEGSIAPGRYSFPLETLKSSTLPEVCRIDTPGHAEHVGWSDRDCPIGDPVRISGTFRDGLCYGPSVQVGRVEWDEAGFDGGGRFSYADVRVIELTPVS